MCEVAMFALFDMQLDQNRQPALSVSEQDKISNITGLKDIILEQVNII
jgi:hypothetical protein